MVEGQYISLFGPGGMECNSSFDECRKKDWRRQLPFDLVSQLQSAMCMERRCILLRRSEWIDLFSFAFGQRATSPLCKFINSYIATGNDKPFASKNGPDLKWFASKGWTLKVSQDGGL